MLDPGHARRLRGGARSHRRVEEQKLGDRTGGVLIRGTSSSRRVGDQFFMCAPAACALRAIRKRRARSERCRRGSLVRLLGLAVAIYISKPLLACAQGSSELWVGAADHDLRQVV